MILFISKKLYPFGIDYVVSPQIISTGEIYLLSKAPTTAFYQPAAQNEGLSINHSNPFGFSELNFFHLATQTKIFKEYISAGIISVENRYFADRVFYLGYSKKISNISFGGVGKYYQYKTIDYLQLASGTFTGGMVWNFKKFTSGVSVSNITQTQKNNISLPSVYKYELSIKPVEKTEFAFSFEKEKNYDYRYAFGAIQIIHPTLFVSTGFISNPDQFSAGLCLKINNLDLNYAVRTHPELNMTHSAGITYRY